MATRRVSARAAEEVAIWGRAKLRIFLLIAICLIWPGTAGAKALAVSNGLPFYYHTAFTAEKGAPPGVNALAQTPDGILWLGTTRGLYRFDGVTFEAVTLPSSIPPRSNNIAALVVDRTGALWVGHDWGGVEVFRGGHFYDMDQGYRYSSVTDLMSDSEGQVWVISDGLRYINIQKYREYRRMDVTSWLGVREKWGRSIDSSHSGDIWLNLDGLVGHLDHGSRHFDLHQVGSELYGNIIQGPGKTLLLADNQKLRAIFDGGRWNDGKVQPLLNFKSGPPHYVTIHDQSGGLWIGATGDGIYHIEASPDGRSIGQVRRLGAESFRSPLINAMLVDREGGLWVGTSHGLDQFSPSGFSRVRTSNGATTDDSREDESEIIRSVDGKSLLVKVAHSYFRIDPEHGRLQTIKGLAEAQYRPCLGENGTIWTTTKSSIGRLGDRKRIALPKADRDAVFDHCLIVDNGRKILLTTYPGLFERSDNKWNRVEINQESHRPSLAILVRSYKGDFLGYVMNAELFSINGGRARAVFNRSGNPVSYIDTILPQSDADLFGGTYGLARHDSRGWQVLKRSDYPFLNEVSGIADGPHGITWLLTGSGLVRLSSRELSAAFDRPGSPLHARVYGEGDGFDAVIGSEGYNALAVDAVGHVWLATDVGIYMFDPNRVLVPSPAPPISITAMKAANSAVDFRLDPTLPARTPSVEIGFAAGSLRDPTKVAFRYRLLGLSTRWVDAGSSRQAIFAELPPGDYSFQVIGANADGVWNLKGASVDFHIPPTFVQSRWFTALCCFVGLVLVIAAYRVRLRQLASRLRARFEAQAGERERIARELHDTLLQGVQALIIGLQNIVDDLPERLPARERMLLAMERAEFLLAEGRDRVHDLRRSNQSQALDAALAEIVEQDQRPSNVETRLAIGGERQEVDGAVSQELVRIVDEALANAYRHAGADHILISIDYGTRSLVVRVEDDGRGGATEAAPSDNKHFGLLGMRERASRIGGKWSFSSRPGQGTTIKVTVPARIAYRRQRVRDLRVYGAS